MVGDGIAGSVPKSRLHGRQDATPEVHSEHHLARCDQLCDYQFGTCQPLLAAGARSAPEQLSRHGGGPWLALVALRSQQSATDARRTAQPLSTRHQPGLPAGRAAYCVQRMTTAPRKRQRSNPSGHRHVRPFLSALAQFPIPCFERSRKKKVPWANSALAVVPFRSNSFSKTPPFVPAKRQHTGLAEKNTGPRDLDGTSTGRCVGDTRQLITPCVGRSLVRSFTLPANLLSILVALSPLAWFSPLPWHAYTPGRPQ